MHGKVQQIPALSCQTWEKILAWWQANPACLHLPSPDPLLSLRKGDEGLPQSTHIYKHNLPLKSLKTFGRTLQETDLIRQEEQPNQNDFLSASLTSDLSYHSTLNWGSLSSWHLPLSPVTQSCLSLSERYKKLDFICLLFLHILPLKQGQVQMQHFPNTSLSVMKRINIRKQPKMLESDSFGRTRLEVGIRKTFLVLLFI